MLTTMHHTSSGPSTIPHTCVVTQDTSVYGSSTTVVTLRKSEWYMAEHCVIPTYRTRPTTGSGCAVWGAQLNWTDYGMLSPCSLNRGLYLSFPTLYVQYETSLLGGWDFLYMNAGNNGQRFILNQGQTDDVYCGPFTSQYPATYPGNTQMKFGNIPNAHPCTGGLPN